MDHQANATTRTFATAVFVSSISTVLGILPVQLFIFHPYFIWKFPPEIWRVVTSFFITSPNLGLLFDTYFLYQYLSQLEIGNSRFSRKEDLLWYLMFVSGTMLVSVAQCHCFVLSIPSPCCASYICPDSALPLQLSRFLEMRKITPACQTDPSFAISGRSGV